MALISRLGRPSGPHVISQCLSSPVASLITSRRLSTKAAASPRNKTQVYVSRSRDPFLNLSIEHHLLQKTAPGSTILLLYTNSPCVIFGRNQNPWTEVNLPRLAQLKNRPESLGWTDEPVQLVRRRSGGGTVFHDGGNVNFSVICPPEAFDRDKHAEMVVRALKSLGRANTRVNERHDIVMDVPSTGTFKISGSAYKLTRLRSLHHGTCLLRSPNLSNLSGLLRSPAEAFIKTRGVDSVRSPVRNVDVDKSDFEDAVVDEFSKMYGDFDIIEEVGRDALEIDNITKGYKELRSRDWMYGQTPKFTFSTHPTEQDQKERPALPFDFKLLFTARQGVIERFTIEDAPFRTSPSGLDSLLKTNMFDVSDWSTRLTQVGMPEREAAEVGAWMNGVLGAEFTRVEQQS